MLTGGEPMLHPEIVIRAAQEIHKYTGAPTYLYTADPRKLLYVLPYINGVVLTLHDETDKYPFYKLQHTLNPDFAKTKSMRLNIFKEVGRVAYMDYWKVKENIVWIKNCPLPEDEVFMRYNLPGYFISQGGKP